MRCDGAGFESHCYVRHWWHQLGRLAKTAVLQQKSCTLHVGTSDSS